LSCTEFGSSELIVFSSGRVHNDDDDDDVT